MKCSICQKEMVEQDFGNVHVDVCKNGCKSLWFDWFELSKLDEKNEGVGKALQEALQNPRSNDENRKALSCPKCHIPLKAHQYQSSKEVNVDECYSCGGFLLDSGELKVIKDSFMNESEEKAYLDKLLQNAGFPQAQKDLEKEKKRAEALRHYTRFLRLSYYMTGR